MTDETKTIGAGLSPSKGFSAFLSGMGLPSAKESEEKGLKLLEEEKAVRKPFEDKISSNVAKILENAEALKNRESPAKPDIQDLPDAPDLKSRDPTQALGSLASVIALLGSFKTRVPMTAALNSAAAAMEGFHQGDMERVRRERQKWHDNLEKGIKQNEVELQKYTAALEKENFDIQKAMPMFQAIAADTDNQKMLAASKTGDIRAAWEIYHGSRQAQERLVEAYLKNQERQFQMGQQHADRLAAGWTAFTTKDGKLWAVNPRTREAYPIESSPAGLTKPAGGGASGKITEGERKAATNLNEMKFAQKKMDELSSLGVTNIPISSQALGRLYDPEKGGIISSVYQELRNSMTSTEEQQAFDAALAFTLAQAHAQGGARPSPFQMQMIWNSYIPMQGEDAQTMKFKRAMRENAIESVGVMGGGATNELEKSKSHSISQGSQESGVGIEYNGYRFPNQQALDAYRAAVGE